MTAKRIFDLTICILAGVLWIPVFLVCTLLIFVFDGLPLFYVSERRTFRRKRARIIKFRAMVRNAAARANRETVPIGNQRFLNIPIDSPLYTPIGRLLERMCLTELPQLFQVVTGSLSLVGNRPLPENVIETIGLDFPYVEQRFAAKAGMTGPAQLVGRENLTDEERLTLEIAYCNICLTSYSPVLDFLILLYTVLIGSKLHQPFTHAEVLLLMSRYAKDGITSRSFESSSAPHLSIEAQARAIDLFQGD